MSKQDRVYTRTASDLERKYNFGQTFAEVYGLVEDAQKAVDEANRAVSDLDAKLDAEEVFNRLTNNGTAQGIYRENDNIYINATYIKSGKLSAEYIDAENLKVSAANITGTLTAAQIDASELSVAAANIKGQLTAAQIKLGGEMAVYSSLDANATVVGQIGYIDADEKYDGFDTVGISGHALGIESEGDTIIYAADNLLMVSNDHLTIGTLGYVVMMGEDLVWNGRSIIYRIEQIEQALSFILPSV